jgi:hypothetical protein
MQPDYEAIFAQVKDQPCKVDRIEKVFDKSKDPRTNSHIIDRELQRVYDAGTLQEIHEALEEAGRNLQRLQIFRGLKMLIHEEPEVRPYANWTERLYFLLPPSSLIGRP